MNIEALNGIIEEDIEWFWNNHPIVSCETDTKNLWEVFKNWCMQNCSEVFESTEEYTIEEAVDGNFDNWINKKII